LRSIAGIKSMMLKMRGKRNERYDDREDVKYQI